MADKALDKKPIVTDEKKPSENLPV